MTQDFGLSTVDYSLSTILVTGGCGFMGTNLVKYHSRKVTLRTCRQPKTEPEAITDYGAPTVFQIA